MKKLIVLVAVLFPVISWAEPYLACDPPADGVNITQTIIEVTTDPGQPGQAVEEKAGLTTLQGSDFLLLDLADLPNGKYRFRAKWAESTNWWSDWSEPFDIQKVGKPGNIKIK